MGLLGRSGAGAGEGARVGARARAGMWPPLP